MLVVLFVSSEAICTPFAVSLINDYFEKVRLSLLCLPVGAARVKLLNHLDAGFVRACGHMHDLRRDNLVLAVALAVHDAGRPRQAWLKHPKS